MRARRIAVLGGGVAGLATSLSLSRDGHRVVLIERDPLEASAAGDAFAWERGGIPHFLQPHAFIPRGRQELMENFGDVYASLIREGAHDVDVRRKLPGSPEPGDGCLQYLAARRPLIEWGLRSSVLEQDGIEIHSRARLVGVRLESGNIVGIELEGGTMDADLVVDALGRRSPMAGWFREQGHESPPPGRSDCGVIYYSRYYRLRAHKQLPDGPWLLGPRGDLGYMGFATFPGDNGAFAAVLSVPTGVPELKIFRREPAFEAAVAQIPALRAWASPELAEPITDVLPMGGLQNSIHEPSDRLPGGYFPVADALCHTDPVLAHGLAFALVHATEVSRALRAHGDVGEAQAAYTRCVMPALRERFELATALDEQRLRMWTGGPVDYSRRDADYALFSVVAGGAAALSDPEVFRMYVRRMGLLDSTRVLDQDEHMKGRIEELFRGMRSNAPPSPGVSRGEMLSLAEAAVSRGSGRT